MKVRYFLSRLVVEGFRGINNEKNPLILNFNSDTVNSVFAVNGVGKSSIFEAIDFAIYGRIRKFHDLHSKEQANKYYCNQFHSDGVATIQLEFAPDDGSANVTIQVSRDSKGLRTVKGLAGCLNPDVFLENLKEDFVLLDGRTFRKFIGESPLDRGRSFSYLLGLESYSMCLQALQSISETRNVNSDLELEVLSKKVEAIQLEIDDVTKILKSSYEFVVNEPMEMSELEERAKQVVLTLGTIASLKSYLNGKRIEDVDFATVESEIRSKKMGEKQQAHQKVIITIDNLKGLIGDSYDIVDEEQRRIGEMLANTEALIDNTKGDLFKKLLKSALDFISQEEWTQENECPLCESQLSSSLEKHVSSELDEYKKVAEGLAKISQFWSESKWKKLLSDHEFSKYLEVESQHARFSVFDSKFSSGEVSKNDLHQAIEWTSKLKSKAKKALEDAVQSKLQIESELPSSLVSLADKVNHGRQFKEALLTFRLKTNEANEVSKKMNIRMRWRRFISLALNMFSDAEDALSTSRIRSVDAECKSYFHDIMKVKTVSPNLQRLEGKGELLVQLEKFHGKSNLSASPLLSESYRNALAISIFLAAALKHSGVPRFVVLDDVTSSFDAGHQFFLLDLLRKKLQQPNNPGGLQFIILSHDGLLKKYFDILGGSGDWMHINLLGNPPRGNVMGVVQSEERIRDELNHYLDAGHIAAAESLLRQYLEFVLMQIIRKVGIPVPLDLAKRDEYRMIGKCFTAIESAISLHRSAGKLILDEEKLDDANIFPIPVSIVNFLAHYETGSASSLSIPFLRAAVNSVDEFASCFMHGNATDRTTPRRWYKSLEER